MPQEPPVPMPPPPFLRCATRSTPAVLAALLLAPAPLAAFEIVLQSSTIHGGLDSQGIVEVRPPAPSSNLEVKLSSSEPAVVSVPYQVVVPAGKLSAQFPIRTKGVVKLTPVTLTAKHRLNPLPARAHLGVLPAVPSSIGFDPQRLDGWTPGITVRGRVYLKGKAPSGGLVVTLVAPDESPILPLIDQVTVPEGEDRVGFDAVLGDRMGARLEARTKSGAAMNELRIGPVGIEAIAMVDTLVEGTERIGQVHMESHRERKDFTVQLSASHQRLILPKEVSIPEGMPGGQFHYRAGPVDSPQAVTVTAKLGSGIRRCTLVVIPNAVESVIVKSPRVKGGTPAKCVVTLLGTPMFRDLDVSLSLTTPPAPGLAAPARLESTTLTVARDHKRAEFEIPTRDVSIPMRVSVTAKLGSSVKTAHFEVVP